MAGFAGGTISSSSFEGGIRGAFSAAVFTGVGDYITGNHLEVAQGIALHAVAGCVTSVASGSKCGPGALSAAFSKAAAPTTMQITGGDPFAGALVSAVVGGTASELGGGKFSNGAMTGAFSYLFNELLHDGERHEAMQRAGYADSGSTLVANAMADVGSPDWAYASSAYGPAGVWKCSTYVGDTIEDIGLDAPTYSRWSWSRFSRVDTYWQAGMWADPKNDPSGKVNGWAITRNPLPGDVFAWRENDNDATGHSGVYLDNGNGVWAGKYTINTGSISAAFGSRANGIVYRTYVGP